MRMNLTLIAISLLVLLAGIVCVINMHSSLNELIAEAQLAADALPNNPSAALEAVERFSARWERLEGMWQLFAIHNDLDNVTISMLEAQNALQISNIQDAATACAKLLLSLEEIHQKEVPTPGNIF